MASIRPFLLVILASCAFATQALAGPGEALLQVQANSRAAHSDVLYIVQGGKVVLHETMAGDRDAPIELMSATKAVVALAVMRALDEGKIANLDEPVHRWYPEWKQGRKREITLRMLLSHTSGLQNVANAGVEVETAPDVIKLALSAELDAAPGQSFSYNNKATNLLGGVIERATGTKLDAYVAEQLFRPLGIKRWEWRADKAGNPTAMAGLALSAPDAAKLGQLVLQKGRWNGASVIRSDLIEMMLSAGSPMSPEVGFMWRRTPTWVRYHASTRAFDRLRSAGLAGDIIERLRPLAGLSFSRPALIDALRSHLGPDGMRVWAETMQRAGATPSTIFDTESGPVGAYSAQGYLGQYIVVIPSSNMVVVRQYRWRRDAPPQDSYATLVEDALLLANALAGHGRAKVAPPR